MPNRGAAMNERIQKTNIFRLPFRDVEMLMLEDQFDAHEISSNSGISILKVKLIRIGFMFTMIAGVIWNLLFSRQSV